MRSATSDMGDPLYALRERGLEMLEQDKATHQNDQAEGQAVEEPMNVGRLVMSDGRGQAVEQRSHWIEQQQFSLGSEHVHVVEHRREEYPEGKEDFHDVLDVAEEQACSRDDHANPHAKENYCAQKNRNPKQLDTPADLHHD